MNRLTYLKYGKRGRKVIDRFHGTVTIGKGQGGDGVGLRLQFCDGDGRDIILLIDDTTTLEHLGTEIEATLLERRGFLSKEEVSCRQCGANLKPGDDGFGTESGLCGKCAAN